MEKAVYGLPELNGDRLPGAALVANPGCYATSVILGLAPLLAALGAISALVAKFTIVVVRSEPKPPAGGQPAA